MEVNIQKMRTLLLVKREELLDNIVGLAEVVSLGSGPAALPDPKDASEGPQEFEDRAADYIETQREQSILVNEQALLQEVEEALRRIEDGTYGRCIVCGQPIPEERLRVIPWATRCVKDEEQLERGDL
jgi:DnaK suppressor protein